MDRQAIRQGARRAAMEAEVTRRTERVARERRIADLVVRVLTATGERDAVIGETELRAGQALCEMTRDEGLSLREAVSWLAGRVTVSDAARLRRLPAKANAGGAEAPPS